MSVAAVTGDSSLSDDVADDYYSVLGVVCYVFLFFNGKKNSSFPDCLDL